MTEGGVQLTAGHTQLTILQQNSRQQSAEPSSHQTAAAAPDIPTQSSDPVHAPPLLPAGPSQQPYSNAGENVAGIRGRSDMSQALLFNTTALEDNLAAAQRGDAIDLSGHEDPAESASASAAVHHVPIRQTSKIANPGA